MVFPKISTKNIFGKKKSGKNFEKNKNEKMLAKKKVKFGWGFTVHLKSLPPPQKRGGSGN